MNYLKSFQAFLLFVLAFNAAQAKLKYINKTHTFTDVLTDQALVFSGHTIGYIATQWNTIKEEGSSESYKDNFGRFRFDADNTAWNFAGHTFTGAQVYLFYRARGYRQNRALYLSFLSSLWFEIFIENYTERPSFQDIFNTPIFGSTLGYVIEKGSVEMINSKSKWKRFLGRALNPFSFLVEEEDEVSFSPLFNKSGVFGAQVSISYD